MADPQQYIKFMSDIIDSGTWAGLSSGAKTLYPVLLKFSDQNFKQVWPSTSTLLKLTGFKTKKSVIDAKKDLIDKGLIQTKSGSGHSNSVYYFTFNYPGSKITPRWDNSIHPRGAETHTAAGDGNRPQGDETGHPNHINITITNTQIQKDPEKEKKKKMDSSSDFEKLIDDYGEEIYSYAYAIAKSKDLHNNIAYMRGICKKKTEELAKTTNNKQISGNRVSWSSFLEWTEKKLTETSSNLLKELEVEITGNKLLIFGQVSGFLEQVIRRYFLDNSDIPLEVEFENMPKKNRVFS
jgi:hypothetical protein